MNKKRESEELFRASFGQGLLILAMFAVTFFFQYIIFYHTEADPLLRLLLSILMGLIGIWAVDKQHAKVKWMLERSKQLLVEHEKEESDEMDKLDQTLDEEEEAHDS